MIGFSPGELIRRALFYARAVRPRLIERPLWRARFVRGHFEAPSLPMLAAAISPAHDGVRDALRSAVSERFGIGPSDRQRFTAALRESGVDLRALIEAADETCSRRFDVLGSGPFEAGRPVDWHCDFKSGRRWPVELAWTIDYTELDASSDVKVPWELSRCHWVVWLGQAYWLTGDGRYATAFAELLHEWLASNPPGYGVNWSVPMELAIRSINWIYGIAFFVDAPEVPHTLWEELARSLFWHARVLRGNLEYERHLGNHYVSNGTGLAALGRLFRHSSEGRGWWRTGRRILEQSIRWQVHPDGVDYEKSISYHRLVLECFYLPYAWSTCTPGGDGGDFSREYARRLERMFEFTEAYTRPDGSTPLVSDADDGRVIRVAPGERVTDHRAVLAVGAGLFRRADFLGVAGAMGGDASLLLSSTRLAELAAMERPYRPGSRGFPAGGYYVSRDARSHLFLDAGSIGFDGDAVHGHNDTLSLELWVEGTTYISDSGTYTYTADPALHRALASTSAHNTVQVDNQEIAEIIGMWRIAADLTAPRVTRWDIGREADHWAAEHHGYARLADPVRHRREVAADKARLRWRIVDTLHGKADHRLDLFWHFGPGIELHVIDAHTVVASGVDGALRATCNVPIAILPGWVAPSFGVRTPAPVAQATVSALLPFTFVTDFEFLPRSTRANGAR
jgi:hypothetical protein